MALAPYNGYIAFSETDRVIAGGPVGIDEVRALINDARWAIEFAGRTLIKWVINQQSHERVPDGSGEGSSTSEFYRVFYQLIDVHLREDGCYRFRCRLAGRTTQSAFGSGTLRLAISSPALVETDLLTGTSLTNVMEVSSSSSTHAWLNTGTALTVYEDRVLGSIVEQPTVVSVGGADTNVPVCRLAVLVMSKAADVQTRGALSGVVVEEFYGT